MTNTPENAADVAALDQLTRRWADAERDGDADALDSVLAEDFHAIGPAGFLLDRAAWLDRYRRGDLVNDAFEWQPAQLRTYPTAAIAIGLQRQTTRYRGHPNPGEFRGTLIFIHQDEGWRIAGLHLSPLDWRPAGMPAGGPPAGAISSEA
jgi:hypothetical protein